MYYYYYYHYYYYYYYYYYLFCLYNVWTGVCVCGHCGNPVAECLVSRQVSRTGVKSKPMTAFIHRRNIGNKTTNI